MEKKLNMTWQYVVAAQKANHILGCMKENRLMNKILLVSSMLVRPGAWYERVYVHAGSFITLKSYTSLYS